MIIDIFDTHAHYDDDAFNADRNELLEEMSNVRLGERTYRIKHITNIGCDMETSRQSVSFAKKYKYIYASVGVIPHHVGDMTEADIEELRSLATGNDKVVAIGEIGLDYHYDEPAKEIQHIWFRRQMELAEELGLPVVIHSRDAAQDTYEIMKSAHAEDIGGVVHCYSYSEEMAVQFLKMGFYFGIGGVVTFKNSKKLKRAVRSIPLDKIVLETDAPYLAPSPFRGTRNDSRYLPYVIEEIARLKETTPEEVAEIAYENALKLYKIM